MEYMNKNLIILIMAAVGLILILIATRLLWWADPYGLWAREHRALNRINEMAREINKAYE